MREYIFVVSSHQVCGTLLQLPVDGQRPLILRDLPVSLGKLGLHQRELGSRGKAARAGLTARETSSGGGEV